MIKTILATLCIFISLNAFGQTAVSPDSAKYYEGTSVTVCGKVSSTYSGKNGIIKLQLGGKYPSNTFTAIIFPANTTKFKTAEYYEGMDVCVTGKVTMYKDKPEIEMTDPKQLKEN